MHKTILLFCFLHFCFSSCPNGTISSFTNPNNCYLFVSNKLAFITAEGYCRENGGHLTSISNAFDNMFLSQEAASNFKNNTEGDFWIGGTNELIPGTWTWMDGSPFTFTDWMKGQPENVSISNCAVSSILSSLWTAQDCFKNKTFVCLIPSLISTTTTTTTIKPTTKKSLSCENGWKYYDITGFCYKAFSNFNFTWADAEKYCVTNFNSHLVSIHSQTESDFVADLARDSLLQTDYSPCYRHQCWIGLFTVTNDEIWLWSDNTPFDYFGWSPNEPNNPGRENCVQLILTHCSKDNANYWNNIDCSYNTENFVCKKAQS